MLKNSLIAGKGEYKSEKRGESVIDLAYHNFTIPSMDRFTKVRVHRDHIARPDLISQYMYGDPRYGDLICKLNDISNPMELNEGDVLVLPIADQLDEFFCKDQYANDNYDDDINSDRPIPKHKNQKRTPSDAITNDPRFKIDTENRIIVY